MPKKEPWIRGEDEDHPLPIISKNEAFLMGCPRCEEWIDVTRVFTEQYFDGVYECPAGHKVVFAGLTVEKSVEAGEE